MCIRDSCNVTVAQDEISSPQVRILKDYVRHDGTLYGADTLRVPIRLAGRLRTPQGGPAYAAAAVLLYLMHFSTVDVRRPEGRRHGSEYPVWRPRQLAAVLGYSPSTIRRAAAYLRGLGVLSVEDGRVRLDAERLWSLCAYDPLKPMPENLRAILAAAPSPERQSLAVQQVLFWGSCVELPFSLLEGFTEDGRHIDYSAISAYAFLIWKSLPYRKCFEDGTAVWRQHFEGAAYTVRRKTLKLALGTSDPTITRSLKKLDAWGLMRRSYKDSRREIGKGEPASAAERRRGYRISRTSEIEIDAGRYLDLCRVKRRQAPDVIERHTPAMAKPAKAPRKKARREVPMPLAGTVTEENVAEVLDRMARIQCKDDESRRQLEEQVRLTLSIYPGLTPQHLAELFVLYRNTDSLWLPGKGGPEEIRFARKWLELQKGLSETLAYEKANAFSIEKRRLEELTPEEVCERAEVWQDSDGWWQWCLDRRYFDAETISGSRFAASEGDARRLLRIDLGVDSPVALQDLL